MRVLAIDTALEACSAALLDTHETALIASKSRPMTRGHAETLVPLIAEMMAQTTIDFSHIDRFAVTTGPGSFTGLRVGIAAARGMALAAGKPAVGLTTLAALAAPLIAEDDKLAVAAAIDARHDNVYLQVFGANGRTLVQPRLLSIAEAVRAASVEPMRLVGSGAALLAAAWPKNAAPLSVDARRAPDIAWVARLGAAAGETSAPPKPLYLRAAEAHPQTATLVPRR